MEKLIPRENVQVGYGKSPDPEDMDFNDVFGGPPRRFSMQEVRERYSFGNSEEETTSPPWGALKDKPVFGEESTPRRRRKGTDFFNDIFKGGDGDRDSTFGSNPSSRIMSPRADSLGTSLPAASQFSLPAKSTKAMDLPTFGSNNHGQYKVDGGGNGVSSPQSWSALSRFSNEAARDDSHMNEVRPVDGVENQFHFSIYKWAGKGVPMLMPLVIGNNLKSNMKYEKSPSSNERMDSKSASVKKQQGSSVASKEEQVKSVDERSKGERIEIEVPVKISEGLKPEGKPLHAFLVEGDQSGETKVTYDSKKVKEKGKKGVDSKNANSEAIQVKSAAGKGKVKEFVQIFNQEPDVKGSQSSRMGNVGTEQKGFNEVSSNPAKVKEEANLHNAAKKPDVTFKVVEDLNNEEAHTKQGSSPMKTSSHTRMRSSSTLRRSFSAGTIPKDMKMSPENLDDSLEDNFVVQELHDDLETVAQNDSSDETKVIDAKIRQWSVGKKGNIRSLLSTLQYVLWQESGWKPVPLVDLIETSSVKRAYQKALLRLHPDKLQQKGAAFHQKYTAEKVFDILQEAWDHFNSCSSLGI